MNILQLNNCFQFNQHFPFHYKISYFRGPTSVISIFLNPNLNAGELGESVKSNFSGLINMGSVYNE